jgi:Spherulation-specific family 4/Putative Ig domain
VRAIWVAVACTTAACLPNSGASVPARAAQTSASSQHILVPSFIVPGSGWDGIAQAYPTAGIALLNVDSGPGTGPEAAFQAQVSTETAAGIQMYGYVSTGYGDISLATAESDIHDYNSWYGVKNIFVDEASTSCTLESSYYLSLYNYIHAQGGSEILNPGTTTSQCYMSATDILDTFEGTYTQYESSTPSSWASQYPASRFFNEVYNVPTEAEMARVVGQTVQRGAGWVYVTNLNVPNPYDALPSYWSAEVQEVGSLVQPLTITTTSLPAAVAHQSYSQQLGASGGILPYRWSRVSGRLPPDLYLSRTGLVHGKPGSSGTWTFTVRVADKSIDHQQVTQSMSITVAATSTTSTTS